MERVNKNIIFDKDAREKVIEGARAVHRAVSQAYGVTSGNVLIEKEWGKPVLTHDGITIAREVFLEDPNANASAQLLIEASQKTNDIAGDGTSATVILGYEVVKRAVQRIASGSNAMSIKRGIDKASAVAKEIIDEWSSEVDSDTELRNVATVSAGDEAIGTLIANTISEIGEDGGINVEEYQGIGIEQEVVDGYYFDHGYISPQMATDSSGIVNYENCWVAVTERKLSAVADVLPLLQKIVALNGGKPGGKLLIVGDVTGDALNVIIFNSRQIGSVNTVCVHPPIYGDQQALSLEDIAILTGGKLIRNMQTIDDINEEDLGKADKVNVTSTSTTIIGGKGEATKIEYRVNDIKGAMKAEKNEFRLERMKSRISKLTGRVGIIRVGGATETEMKEVKMRVDDAVHATQAALTEGIVVGGGVCLLRVGKELLKKTPAEIMDTDEYEGWKIVCEAFETPFLTLMANSNQDGSYNMREILEVEDVNVGFNMKRPTEEPVNLFAEGIIDPAKVVKMVVENALSYAGNAITTNCIMTMIPKEIDEK